VIYRPQYQVRLVQPSEIPSLKDAKSKTAPRPKPVPQAKKAPKKRVVVPDKRVQKKKAVKKKKASEEVLDDVLARLKQKVDTREKKEAPSDSGPQVTGWEGKQKALRYSAYYDQVEQRVRENWIPPQSLDSTGQDVITVVSITLLPDGRVLRSLIEESSGDPIFDQSVMRAIMKSSPLPAPPIGLNQKKYDLGLRFHSSPHNR